MLIRDTDGDEFTYLPISGLKEGDTVGPITVYIETPNEGSLSADFDARMTITARVTGVGSYVNINATPLDLSGMAPGTTGFDIKVTANSPIVGLERVPLYVAVSTQGPAGWN